MHERQTTDRSLRGWRAIVGRAVVATLFAAQLVGVVCGAAGVAEAASKGKSRGKKKPKTGQPVSRAASAVRKEEADVAGAAAQVGLAKTRLDQARDHVASTRRELVNDQKHSPTLQAAQRLWQEARAELADASGPVLDQLDNDPDYKAAVAERDALRKRAVELKAGTAEQSRVQSEWAEASGRVRQLEKAALLNDPRTKKAAEWVEEQERDLRQIVERQDGEMQGDARLGSAAQDAQRAKAALANAQAQYGAELRQLAAARQTLAAKAAAQAANNNPTRKNGRGR